MAVCSSCRAPVVWTVTTNGRRLPVDGAHTYGDVIPLEVDDGNVIPTGELDRATRAPVVFVIGAVLELELYPNDETPAARWRPHFATCPNAGDHRRRNPR
jgi:hypothetical protein